MKFSVERTSDFFHEKCPCENANKSTDSILDDVPLWTIEINSLTELIDFIDKYGQVILAHNPRGDIFPNIEIYDSYRE